MFVLLFALIDTPTTSSVKTILIQNKKHVQVNVSRPILILSKTLILYCFIIIIITDYTTDIFFLQFLALKFKMWYNCKKNNELMINL